MSKIICAKLREPHCFRSPFVNKVVQVKYLLRSDVDRFVENQPDRRFPAAWMRRATLISHVPVRVGQKSF